MTPRSVSHPRPTYSEAGFTLLEVLAAFVVLSLAISGLVYMGSISSKGNTRSQDQATAMALATDKIEYLKSLDFNSSNLVTGSGLTGIQDSASYSPLYTMSWEVASGTLESLSSKDISVTVSWTGGGSVQLKTTVVDPPTLSSGELAQFPTVAITSWNVQ